MAKDRPTPEQDERTGRFLPGNSGNGGRPKGARSKLSEAFLADVQADWEQHGPQVIEAVRTEKPDQYMKVIASILPKDLNINVNQYDEMTDDELVERIRSLDAAIRPFLDAEAAGGVDGGVGPAQTH